MNNHFSTPSMKVLSPTSMFIGRFRWLLASILFLFAEQSLVNAQCQTCCNGSKPKTITFLYNGKSCAETVTCQAAGKWSCSGGGPNNAASVYITATKNSNGSGGTYFAGNVALNAAFTVNSATGGSNTFSANTYFRIFSSQGGTLLQTVGIHTSCSTPLVTGDQLGALVISNIILADNTNCGPPPNPCTATFTNTGTQVGRLWQFFGNNQWSSTYTTIQPGATVTKNVGDGQIWQIWNVADNQMFAAFTIDCDGDTDYCFTQSGATSCTPPEECPVPVINPPSQQICPGVPVTFSAQNLGFPCLTYTWNFGSNATPSTATGLGPISVVFSSVGNVNVSLTAANNCQYVPPPNPPMVFGCCDQDERGEHDHPHKLILEYVGSSSQNIIFRGTDGPSFTFFSGQVSNGDVFVVDGTGHTDKHGELNRLDTDTEFKIGSSSYKKVHTSCSQDISPGYGISSNGTLIQNGTSSNSVFIVRGVVMLQTGSGSSLYCEEGITDPSGGGGSGSGAGTTVCGATCFDCEKTTNITVQVAVCDPCVGQGGDTDGDGVCNNQDCAPNNPNLPTTPGTACNDGNPNTGYDIIQSDGCSCAGTPLPIDLELTKLVNKSIAAPGETALWTISVINKGPAAATNVTVRDNFPAGLTYNSANASQGSFNVGTLTWDIGNLAVNQTVTLTINTTVTATSGTIRNFAQIQTANPNDIDSTPGNDTNQTVNEDDEDDATITVNPCINLGGDSDGDGVCNNLDCAPLNPNLPTTPGTACNDSNPNTVNDVIQADGCSCAGTPVPTNVDLELTKSVNASTVTTGQTAVWTISVINKGPSPATGVTVKDNFPAGLTYNSASASQGSFNAGTLTWDIGNLAVNQTVTLTINTTVTATSGTIRNFAQIQTASPNDIDSTPGNDTNQTPNEDDEDDATITVQPCANQGGDSDGDGVCNNQDCAPNNPNLPTTPGTACNDGNPNTNNDVIQADGCSCAGTSPLLVDLELTKKANKNNVSTGETVLWTISVINNGPAAATGVTVKDNFPAGLTYNSANASQGSFDVGTLTWNIGNLAVNQAVSLTIQTTVTATSGIIRNFAQVQTASPNDVDSTPGNDSNQTVNEDDEDDATINVVGGGTPDCVSGISITTSNGKITVTGLDGSPVSSLQVFSASWQQVFNCFANCGASQIVTVPAGTYYVYAKYYTAGYSLICEKQATVTVTGGDPCANLGGDTDGDGVCNNNDCQPNNPAFPATPGSPCNDGNPNTSNDLVTANGCGCAGTPTNVCDNITNGGSIGFGTNCAGSVQHCPNSGAAPTIGSCTAPAGGTGNLEIVWLKSTTSCTFPTTTAAQIAAGLDPHWTMISGATCLSYSPGTVTQQTCYLRCSRRAGCPVFVESNIVTLGISSNCGGGGNGTPDCSNIGISTGAGNITVTGLNGAPVVSVQIFSAAWQPEHTCFANCQSPTATFPVPAGAHYVYVKYYTAQYQLICEVNQTVNVAQALGANQAEDLQFNAVKQLEHVELFWVHLGDFKVDEYLLERSVDGKHYEIIYALPSEKDASANVYEGYDLAPQIGKNHYRVKMLNEDGSVNYSEERVIEYEDLADFSIFPNPANDFTNINMESIVGWKNVDIHIYNNMGVRRKHFHLDEVWSRYYQMDLRELHEGHYTVWLDIPGRRAQKVQLVIGKL